MKTKLGQFATLLVVIAVVSGIYLMKSPAGKQPAQDEREIIAAGLWAPTPRLPDGVHVEVLNGGRPEVDKVIPNAPYAKVFMAKVGAIVEIRLRLLGGEITDVIGCSLSINGIPTAPPTTARKVGRHFQLICRAVVI
jgi:hypothetical protein